MQTVQSAEKRKKPPKDRELSKVLFVKSIIFSKKGEGA